MYHLYLSRYAARWFGRDEGPDAVSRTWLEAMRSWDTWRGEGARRSWLLTILRYEWCDWLSKLAKRDLWRPITEAARIRASGDLGREVERRDYARKVMRCMDPLKRQRLTDWAAGLEFEKSAASRAVCHARHMAARLDRTRHKAAPAEEQ